MANVKRIGTLSWTFRTRERNWHLTGSGGSRLAVRVASLPRNVA